MDQIFAGPCGWDAPERDISYYGRRLGTPLPDTIYFSVYGNPHIYVDKPTYQSLSKDRQWEAIHVSGELAHERRLLGQIIFIKSDSIIFENKHHYENDKLLIKRPANY